MKAGADVQPPIQPAAPQPADPAGLDSGGTLFTRLEDLLAPCASLPDQTRISFLLAFDTAPATTAAKRDIMFASMRDKHAAGDFEGLARYVAEKEKLLWHWTSPVGISLDGKSKDALASLLGGMLAPLQLPRDVRVDFLLAFNASPATTYASARWCTTACAACTPRRILTAWCAWSSRSRR